MEYNIIINQAALRKWVGKINLLDAAIVGFVRSLTPDDPAVRHYMLSGHYRLEAKWILRQMPLLDVSEDWLLRTLKKLKTVGLLDTFSTLGPKKRLKTYGRLSAKYFEEEQNARDLVENEQDRYSEKNPRHGENSATRRKIPVAENDPGETPIDHEEDQCKAEDGPPPGGGAVSASEEKDCPAGGEAFSAWLDERRARSPPRGGTASPRDLLKHAPMLPGMREPGQS